jgi:hypothetical protein
MTEWSSPLGTSVTLKIDQKSTNGEKIMTPKLRRIIFTKKFSIKQLIAYFRIPQKILKYTFLPLELEDDL